MKYNIEDKVIFTITNEQLTIRDILPNPIHPIDLLDDSTAKVYYFYETSSWLYESVLKPDYKWIREQKLKELGI